MSLAILAEQLARIEHKVDAICREVGIKTSPMYFVGLQCPVCKQDITYLIDVVSQVVVRRCGCSTGKVPSTMPLLPVAPQSGASNGNPPADEPEPAADGAKDGPRRKAR